MAEIQYSWPERSATKILGGTQSRLDGMAKATGTAKYTYDINLKSMLIARGLGCPHAHCKIVTMDTSASSFWIVPVALVVVISVPVLGLLSVTVKPSSCSTRLSPATLTVMVLAPT